MNETTRAAFCPNCGKRYLNVPDDFFDGDPGCGDCAQGRVRPRELYQLKRLNNYGGDTICAPRDPLCDGCGQEIAPGEEHTFCYPGME